MVFCGKPSGSCHACRERKTKCDKVSSGCTQCKRAKRACPGYRAAGELRIRDESMNIVRKSKAAEAKKKLLFANSPIQIDDDGGFEVAQNTELYLSYFQLEPTIEELATSCFITNYLVTSSRPSQGHLDLIKDIFEIGVLDDCLLSSMQAVGLASFAHMSSAPSLLNNAFYQYLRAIRTVNTALRDPVDVKKDSTLLAIMILGIFESVTGCRVRSLHDWAEHMRGAAAVIKLRGPDQIKTQGGRRVLIHAAGSFMISCINDGTALPDHIIEYVEAAYKIVGTPDPAFTVQHTMMRYTSLQAEVAQKSLTDPQIIISRAMELDQGLLDIIVDGLPEGWEYETVHTDLPSDFVFNGRYHIYQDYWRSQMWNYFRTARLLIHEMIRNTLLSGFAAKPPIFTSVQYTAQFQISTDTMHTLQADILCTVPQHIGYFPAGKSDSKAITGKETSIHLGMKASSGMFLLWPLFFSGLLDIATEEIRQFAISNLHFIGRTMGIQQGHVLGQILEGKMALARWKQNVR